MPGALERQARPYHIIRAPWRRSIRSVRCVPNAADAARIAAVPYDVVSTDEARALADGNPLSFLRVSRAELELARGRRSRIRTPSTSAPRRISQRCERRALVVEDEPSVYFYRLRMGDHEQTGLAACFSLDEYDRDVIKKHERTRRDKEDDRTRHMMALGAQTGPVFLTYRAAADVDRRRRRASRRGRRSSISRRPTACSTRSGGSAGADRDALVAAFGRIPALYIADGHHRAASAARARDEMRERGLRRARRSATAPMRRRCWPWRFRTTRCRSCRTTGSSRISAAVTPEQFLAAVRERFTVEPGPATPARRGDIAMYFEGAWHTLRPRVAPDRVRCDRVARRQRAAGRLLAPVLKIADVRTDKRIDFVGGARGTGELETAGRFGQGGGRVLAVSGQRRRSDGRVRRRRDHAAQDHVVRAEAAGRVADSRHLTRCTSVDA